MMISEKLSQKPNDSIFLEDISITHIESQWLPKPCSARVTLRLSPTIMCRIDSDNLPIWLIEFQDKTFLVTLNNGRKVKVLLSYNLNDFFYNSSSNETFKGFLVPYKCPCTVIQPDTQIRCVSFSVLNFQRFHSGDDKWMEVDGKNLCLGFAEMKHDGWQVHITETPTFSETEKELNRDNGYAVTHTGLIKRSNGETFCVYETENILRRLRAFLSFARGSACGFTLVKAIAQDGKEIILEWGTTHIEPWNQGSDAWLSIRDGGDSLSQLFPGFWDLYDDPDWRGTIGTVIDWYLNSNNSPFHIGVILAQAALESLSYKIVGKQIEPKHKELRESLNIIGIDEKIPGSCNGLMKFSATVMQKKSQYIGDGPEAIVEIRNDLVHSKKKYGHNTVEAQMDAQKLSRWYIEMILLKMFGYSGRYKNRLTVSGNDPYEYVPWDTEYLERITTE